MKIDYFYLGLLRDSFFFSALMVLFYSFLSYLVKEPFVLLFYCGIAYIWFKSYFWLDNNKVFFELIQALFLISSFAMGIMILYTFLTNFIYFLNVGLFLFVVFFVFDFVKNGFKLKI